MTADYCCGSSPRAWGIHFIQERVRILLRFIPTCVGNTMPPPLTASASPVHPHVRGEYEAHVGKSTAAAGSSPRAWGIPGEAEAGSAEERFIPTCVGNTCAMCSANNGQKVHPHVRGEYPTFIRSVPALAGSSPRAWGIHQAIKFHVADDRFIPTCVGNTSRTQ